MNRRLFSKLSLAFAAGGIALSGCSGARSSAAGRQTSLSAVNKLMVFRSPTCGCCEQWVDHMTAAGFQVQDKVTDEMVMVKQRYGVPPQLESCHTALVNGYVIEGHVPAADVQRLLAERPDVAGIAAPGMPAGSPGMEQGDRIDPYRVVSFTAGGATAIFAEHL